MANEIAIVSRLNDPDDIINPPQSIGPMTNDETNAAGWLAEALSGPGKADSATESSTVKSPGGVATMGDAILRGLTKVSNDFMKTAGELHTSMENNTSGTPSIMGALRMHIEFTLVSTQAEVISKCVTKSEQTIEQLVKQQ